MQDAHFVLLILIIKNTFKSELTLDEIDQMTKNLGKSLLNVNLTGGNLLLEKILQR